MTVYIVSGDQVRIAARRPSKLGKGEIIAASVEDLAAARLNTTRLMAIWNALPGKKKITKVTDRAALTARLWDEFEALSGGAEKAPDAKAMPARKTKQGAVIALLRRVEGATVDEMANATGWQHHTVRGALAGALKKRLGLRVSSTKEERGRVYRIPDAAARA
jgi:hypothetical protein